MHLDSARELKTALVQKHEPFVRRALMAGYRVRAAGPAAGARTISELGIGACAVTSVDAVQRTLALGITRSGRNDFRLAVRIQNRAFEHGPHIEAIHKQAKGEVDIRYIGRVVKRVAPWTQTRRRPLQVGTSIGHFSITAGTLGCFVKTRQGGQVRILSNNHVLADENRGVKGDAVIQPGRFDHGRKGRDTIGALDRFVTLKKRGANAVDAALAALRQGMQFDAGMLKGIGELTGVGGVLDEDVAVSKVGRTTEVTHGRVTAFELDHVIVGYDIGNLRFDDQIEIEGSGSGPFSQGGDSGSLILNATRQGVALLFAGGDQGGSNGQGLTYANPIATVLDRLKIDLLY
jgi:hypothetical protein